MANFLEGFGKSSSGTDVYVAVSLSNRIEVATIVNGTGRIDNYAQADLDYNEAQREIVSYQDFKNKLADLLAACNINPAKANIHLSLPTVWFGYKEGIPLMLDDPAVTNIIMGELEQTYIFKRKDPIPFWFDAMVSTNSDSRSVFYTALQEDVKNSLRDAIAEIGATLVSIDCSTFANLRALYSTGIATEQMESPGYSWSLMIVNNSGFQIFGMQNKKILEYYEEPIAIKSYEGDEIYAAIDSSAQVSLLSSPSSSLIIISETDLVSAEILAKNLQFTGSIIPIEDNKFKKAPFIDLGLNIVQENQIKVSLHMLGLVANQDILPMKLNFLEVSGEKAKPVAVIEIPLGGDAVFLLTPQKATIMAIALMVFVGIISGLGIFIPSQLESKYRQDSESAKTQLEQVNTEIKK